MRLEQEKVFPDENNIKGVNIYHTLLYLIFQRIIDYILINCNTR
jgi:hypothetical protein